MRDSNTGRFLKGTIPSNTIKFSEEEDAFLVESYGILSLEKIAKHLGYSKSTIVKRRKKIKAKERQDERIEKCFHELGFRNKVQEELGVSTYKIRKILKNKGIRDHQTKKSFVESNRSDEELAYLLGVVASDGCLSRHGSVISLSVSVKDLEWLERVSFLIFKNPKIYKSRDKITISGKAPILYQNCLNISIHPNKTHTLNVKLEAINDKLRLFFLRGFIDGDGTIMFNKRPLQRTIAIDGASRTMLETIQKFFGGSIQNNTQKNGKVYYRIVWSGERSKDLSKKLPKNSYMLGRKTHLLNQISETSPKVYRVQWREGGVYKFCNSNGITSSYRKVLKDLKQGMEFEDILLKYKNEG